MVFKYGDIISLKDGVKPQMSLDADEFFNLPDDENVDTKTYWGLSEDAFEKDDTGLVFLKSEYAKRFRWGVDSVIQIDDDESGVQFDRLNINVAYDPEGVVNCGAFCSFVNDSDVEGFAK